jgi:hypothetical protein
MKQKLTLSIICIITLILCITSFSGCLESNDENISNLMFSLNGIKSQFQFNVSFQKILSNNSTNYSNKENWTRYLFTYTRDTINESSKYKWTEQKYTAKWNYYILSNFTKKQGNITIFFDENYTVITKFYANDSFTDKTGKTWSFRISAKDIPLIENMSSDKYKRYMLRGKETCSNMIILNFTEKIPSIHQKLTPGTTSLIDFSCNNYSTISISFVQSE